MNIAMLLGGAGFDSEKRTINGILENAVPDGENVFIFAGGRLELRGTLQL